VRCSMLVQRILAVVVLAGMATGAAANGIPICNGAVSDWSALQAPADKSSAEAGLWHYRAQQSSYVWRVYADADIIRAASNGECPSDASAMPDFKTGDDRFQFVPAYDVAIRVGDGWLVAFDRGEFGASVYWFNRDGSRSTSVSGHHVQQFMILPDGVLAIEGLSHLVTTTASLVRFEPRGSGAGWTWHTIRTFDAVPLAFVRRGDGDFVVLFDGGIARMSPAGDLKEMLLPFRQARFVADTKPTSMVLSADESKAYVGTRQFVIEFDLEAEQVRYLVPDLSYLTKVSPEMEDTIRKLSEKLSP
jgi:hypothetical protein